jgi:ubiquinone/menaquinone biosynthesis C-methylase UbiE
MLNGITRRFIGTAILRMSASSASAAASSNLRYDAFVENYATHSTRITKLHAADLIGLAEAHIRSAKRILELGCGAGSFGLAYHQKFPDGIDGQTIVCTDLSPAMVETAKCILNPSTASSATTFHYQVADATNLSGFADDSFDAIVSVFGIFLVPDRAATLREVRRVLKPGGTLITSAWTSISCNAELQAQGLGSNLHDVFGVLLKPSPALSEDDSKLTTEAKLPPAVQDWFDRDKISEMLRDNNFFSSVTVGRAIHTHTFANVDHIFTACTSTNPHGAALLADPDQVRLAKQGLSKLVAPDGNVNDPVMTFSVSNLVVAS